VTGTSTGDAQSFKRTRRHALRRASCLACHPQRAPATLRTTITCECSTHMAMNRSERFKPYCSRRRVAHPPALESFAFVAHSPLLSSPRECTATQRHSNDGQGRCPASILAVVVGFDSPLCLPSTLTASARLQASQVPLRCSRPQIAIAARPATYLASLMPPPLLSPSSPLASEASSDSCRRAAATACRRGSFVGPAGRREEAKAATGRRTGRRRLRRCARQQNRSSCGAHGGCGGRRGRIGRPPC